MKTLGMIVVLSILMLCGIAARAEIVGRVLLAAGEAAVVRGSVALPLAEGSPVEDKDTLRTGGASNLQVRFTDGSIMSLRENSELAVEEYHYTGRADGLEKAFYRLVKGGLRTVTGVIGRSKRENYQINTITATIGIRGTHYVLISCVGGSCINADGSKAKDGLYGGVTDGIVAAITKSGEFRFGAGDTFFAPSIDSPVEKLIGPPVFLADRLEGQKRKEGKQAEGSGGNSGNEQTTTGGIQADSRPNTIPAPLPSLPFLITQNLGPNGTASVLPPANGWLVIYPLQMGVENAVFDDKDPAVFGNSNQLLSYGSGAFPTGSLNGGTIVDSGSITFASGQVFTWGRWTGNTTVVTSSGSTLMNVPVLFGTATGLAQNESSLLPSGGTATYTFVGGPHPVDFGGNVGNVTSSSLLLNFTARSATFSTDINFPSIGTFGSANFSVSGVGGRTTTSHSGDFSGSLTGTCSGGGCRTSMVTGGFGVGTTGGINDIDFAVVAGGFGATQAGSVAFLNTFLNNGFTPGPPPAPQKIFQFVFTDTPSSIGTGSQGPNGSFTFSPPLLTSYTVTSPSGTQSGNLNAGSVVESTPAASASVQANAAAAGNVQWGRWTGAFQVVNGGSTLTPGSGLHYIYGDMAGTLPTTGSAIYTFIGGTNPTTSSGQVGTFTGGAFNVNFLSQTLTVSTPLTFTMPGGLNYSLNTCTSCTYSSPQASFINAGATLSGLCTGGGCSLGVPASGNLNGGFTGATGQGLVTSSAINAPGVPITTFTAAFKR